MFNQLPQEVKELVVRGIYSLFELLEPCQGYHYVLIQSNKSGILLDAEGSNQKNIDNLASLKLGKILTLKDVKIPESVKVHNIL